MRVAVEVPDPPRLEPILEELNRQYQAVMQRLLQLTEEANRSDRYQPILQALSTQQDALTSAFERMMEMMTMGKHQDRQQLQKVIRQEIAAPQAEASDAMLSAIRGMKKSLGSLPDDLGSVMNRQLKSRQQQLLKQIPVKAEPDASKQVVKKLDQMETALLRGLKKSRNRTFGSNF